MYLQVLGLLIALSNLKNNLRLFLCRFWFDLWQWTWTLQMVFSHVIRRPSWCAKQLQIWLMFCIIIFRVKFLKDFILFCFLYQHGGKDIRWKPPIVVVTNHFEIFITWSVFLVMFYSGCNWFSLSCLLHTFGISFLFFFSCQFESFLLELQEGRKIETFLFCLFLVFGSCSGGAILA